MGFWVLFMPVWVVNSPEWAPFATGIGIHPICKVSGTSATFFMQGGKRAPRLIKALPDGPSIGLMYGYTDMRIRASAGAE